MEVCVLRDMSPEAVRKHLLRFTGSYGDWGDWLKVAAPDRVARFAAILRSWQATRPLPMRRPKRRRHTSRPISRTCWTRQPRIWRH